MVRDRFLWCESSIVEASGSGSSIITGTFPWLSGIVCPKLSASSDLSDPWDIRTVVHVIQVSRTIDSGECSIGHLLLYYLWNVELHRK